MVNFEGSGGPSVLRSGELEQFRVELQRELQGELSDLWLPMTGRFPNARLLGGHNKNFLNTSNFFANSQTCNELNLDSHNGAPLLASATALVLNLHLQSLTVALTIVLGVFLLVTHSSPSDTSI